MFKRVSLLLSALSLSIPLMAQSLSTPTYLNTQTGWQLLTQSLPNNAHFGSLVRYFQTQKNLAFCGVASSAITLNALGVPAPVNHWHYPYHYFNQKNIFSPTLMQQGITPHHVACHGLTLQQLQQIFTDYHLKTQVYYSAQINAAQTERVITQALRSPKNEVLVNYYRPTLNQKGGGHISPVAAVNSSEHAALILDVASYKYAALWVPFKTLHQSMNTIDRDSGKSRGFIVVSTPAKATPATP